MFFTAFKSSKTGPTLEDALKKLAIVCVTLCLSGCGALSATTLRCGTDGESSYLELVSAPQSLSGMNRSIGEMCAFAYEGGEN